MSDIPTDQVNESLLELLIELGMDGVEEEDPGALPEISVEWLEAINEYGELPELPFSESDTDDTDLGEYSIQ